MSIFGNWLGSKTMIWVHLDLSLVIYQNFDGPLYRIRFYRVQTRIKRPGGGVYPTAVPNRAVFLFESGDFSISDSPSKMHGHDDMQKVIIANGSEYAGL